jgi:uncharacterized protein DUF4115
MDAQCLQCHQKLSFMKAVKGQLFCSPEHRELYLQAESARAFERVLTFDTPSGTSGKDAEPAQAPTHAEKVASKTLEVRTPRPQESARRILKSLESRPIELSPAVTTAPSEPEARPPVAIAPRRRIPVWVASGIAAVMAILALAVVFGSSRRSANPLLQSVSAAEPNAAITPLASTPQQVSVPLVGLSSTTDTGPALPAASPAPTLVEPTSPAPPAVRTAASFAVTPPSAAPDPASISPASEVRYASIRVTADSWVAACSDGKEVLNRMLSQGDGREIAFAKRAVVRTGNAGGTVISVDGKLVGPLGPDAALRVIELDPDGFHRLSLRPGDDGSACRKD